MGMRYKPSVYKQNNKYEASFDPALCKANVPMGGRIVGFRQCQNRAQRDGWCTIHHPEYIDKMNAKETEDRERAIAARERQDVQYRERRARLSACERACSGLTTAQLEACGEGGVKRLVEAARALLAVCGRIPYGERLLDHEARDVADACEEGASALVPFIKKGEQ